MAVAAAPDAEAHFRPDLEGLRAVAVVLVLLFHAHLPGFGGGYIGVDVFFVLSGFLITGLIVRELQRTGTVSLVSFYARRARRLLPAAALALVATVVASAIFLPPLRVPGVAGDGAAAALYASNMRFAIQATDYLQAELDPSPLLHYWSLGVEEQFYLFWPAFLLLVARVGRGSLRSLATAIALVGAGSLVLSIVLTGISEPWAFYTLPARAWELALGALLALAAVRGLALPRVGGVAAGWLGVGCIVLAGVVFDIGTPFPGTAALLPTMGAALVIASGLHSQDAGVSPILGLGPFRWLGRISYSLYLWHWPIIVIPAAALQTDLPLPVRVGLALLAVPVAAASQRWVEDPIRHGRFVGLRPRRTLAFAGVLTLAVALLTTGIGSFGPFAASSAVAGTDASGNPIGDPAGDPSLTGQLMGVLGSLPPGASASQPAGSTAHPAPAASPTAGPSAAPTATSVPATPGGPVPADLQPSLATARDSLPRSYGDGCHLPFADTQPGPCVYGVKNGSKTVILFGDSHAAQWLPALDRLARQNDWRLVSLTKSACPTAEIAIWNSSLNRTYTECSTWRTNVLARIAAEHPDLVVVSDSRYALSIDGGPSPVAEHQALWDAALEQTLARVAGLSRHTVLIGDTPRAGVDPPVCLSAHLDDVLACATLRAKALDPAYLAAELGVTQAAGVPMIDPTGLVCPSEPCPVVVGNILVYRDTHHMTAVYSAALAPYLAAELPSLGP
jgi:peptidoglycan/LPS O-acetylase OafA/YrhL